MLKVIDLAPDEIESLDPFHYGRDKLAIRFPQQGFFAPQSRLFTWSNDQALASYLSRFCSAEAVASKHSPIVRYDIEMAKKFGPQGGHFTRSVLESKLKESYEFADAPRTYDTALRGRDALLRMIAARIAKLGMPTVYWVPFTQDTAGGLPRGGRKTEWRNHVDGADYWRHVLPDLPSGRRQRGKDRVVHEDATLNVDYVQPPLTAVREWLKSQFPTMFSAWHNPLSYKWPQITGQLIKGSTFLETDYSSMDNHFSWQTVETVILPIFQLLLTEAEYWHFASFVGELFTQPVFLGDQLWTGLHNLFSGQAITNDFETYYDVCLYLGAHLEAGGSVRTFLTSFEALGDDVLYAASDDMCKRVYDLVVREATANGLVLSTEKTRMQTGEARFCREVYYLALPRQVNDAGAVYVRPAYPPVLALNNVLNPERPADDLKDELLRDFTRLDNIEGYYRWSDVFNMIWSKMRVQTLPASLAVRFEELQLRDWWYRVHGTTYTLGQSISANSYREHFQQRWLPAVIY